MSKATILTNQIIDFIYRSGGFAWRAESSGIYDKKLGGYRTAPKKGVSDILAIIPPNGRLIAIEVKIGADRLSPEQEGFLKNLEHVGSGTIVARNFEDFQEDWKHVIDM